MSANTPITTLFLDIGGVLLTNGWDRGAREEAARKFHLNYAEMDERHHLTFDTYEVGKLDLNEYLTRTVFYEPRSFSRDDFKKFMFAQSKNLPDDMIGLVSRLKNQYCLHLVAVSNEGRELTLYRVKEFRMESFIDFFIMSSFVHFRKPDLDIYRVALDLAQAEPGQVAYIDDRAMFVEVAAEIGIRGIHHTGYEATRAALAEMGLVDDGPESPDRQKEKQAGVKETE